MSESPGAQRAEESAAPAVEATPEAPIEGAEDLGDKGKKALDAMKSKWKEADRLAKEQGAELAALRAAAEGREAEHAATVEAQKVREDALNKANERILKSEIRGAAKGELANPEDALVFLDLSQIEVSEDGAVDSGAVEEAIKALLVERPYLAAQGERRFTGTVDSGPRNEGDKTPQLSRADLARMTPEQVVAARQKGQLKTLLGS